jgi:D-3-phosphoglycerate dehydrogenase / 2-oxoglutarate reductase
MTTRKALAAGDRFVLSRLIVEALQREAGNALNLSTLDLPWPIEPFGHVAEVEEASGTEEQMVEVVGGIEVVVTQMAPLTSRVLESADALRLIVCTRGGPVNVNVEVASEKGVPVCYAPGRNAAAAAEYAMGLILSAMRRIQEAHSTLSSGQWRGDFYAYEECGIELDGSTVGLVGFGAIGRRVARVLVAFGAEVLVYDPFVDAADVEDAGGSPAELHALLERSRVVSLHARLSPDTQGMIGAREISRMPQGSVLVNTARGGLLDYEALCDALESGHLGAAALDVYPEEPVPEDSRLLKAPRLVLSPHIAGATKETAQRAARIAAEEVGRYVRGEQLVNVINREAMGDLA